VVKTLFLFYPKVLPIVLENTPYKQKYPKDILKTNEIQNFGNPASDRSTDRWVLSTVRRRVILGVNARRSSR
jgi:hypothetical protein